MNVEQRIERDRKRIALSYIDYCKSQHGVKVAHIKVPRKKMPVVVELSEAGIKKGMIERFENLVMKSGITPFVTTDEMRCVADTYAEFFDPNNGKLTQQGFGFMEALMVEMVSEALKQPKGSDLKVVAE
ncbi:hypothetical protein [Rouxiella chamberiensis]|uniref:Uncharacterized protein n=1 Tax=Rouxiella chamberiensis TaxID=1513468 RepID=A0ABY7HQ17_9GAMM|nr:hypothetical protein [Rouxiella chamberiensis]WAT01492.1 hypothetical protein O1V66_01520 [Rouxiella chamberiensis]